MMDELLGLPEEEMLEEEVLLEEEEPKKKEAPKDDPKDKEAEKDLLESMMFSPSAGDADSTLEIDKTTDVEEEDLSGEELLKILEKGEGKIAEKYKEELLQQALEDPSSVEIETPEGWMTMREAIERGYDMLTGEFSNEPIDGPDWDEEISQLDPREQETIRNLTQRDTPQAGPMDPMMGEDPMMGGDPMMMEEEGAPIGEPGIEEMLGGLEGGL